MAAPAPLIAILNHDPAILKLLQVVLSDNGLRLVFMAEGADAPITIKQTRPDLIVLDTWLEDREAGWQVIDDLRRDKETRHIPILVCSSDHTEFKERIAELEQHSGIEVLNKPHDIDQLATKIRLMLSGGMIGIAQPAGD